MKRALVLTVLASAGLTVPPSFANDQDRAYLAGQLKECEGRIESLDKGIAAAEGKKKLIEKQQTAKLVKAMDLQQAREKALNPRHVEGFDPVTAAKAEVDRLVKKIAEIKGKEPEYASDGGLNDFANKWGDKLGSYVKDLKEARLALSRAKVDANEALRRLRPPLVGIDNLEDLDAKMAAYDLAAKKDGAERKKLEGKIKLMKEQLELEQNKSASLATRLKELGPPVVAGPVRIIYGLQIPTPKSGMDIPLKYPCGPEWPDVLEDFPLLEIDPADPRTAAYYKALREDFAEVFLATDDKPAPPTPEMFKRCGAELAKLMEAAEKAKFKDSALHFYPGAHLVRVTCAGQVRYIFYPKPGTDGVEKSYGGVQLFGLQPKLYPVEVVVASADGKRYFSEFEIEVSHKMRQMAEEVWEDGKLTDKKIIHNVTVAFSKAQFTKHWGYAQKSLASAKSPTQRKGALGSCVNGVYHAVDGLIELPGCTPADIGPILAKGAESMGAMLTEFGGDTDDDKVWTNLTSFSGLCLYAACAESYAALAAVAPKAASAATGRNKVFAAMAYRDLAEIAIMLGRFGKAAEYINTSIVLHANAGGSFDKTAALAAIPTAADLEAMLAVIEGK